MATVARVAVGSSLREHLDFIAPEGDFAVRDTTAERTVVTPASFDRYDAVAATFASLAAEAAASLYERLLPLFEEAHRELDLPDGRFEATLAPAVERLLAVEVPDTPVRVVENEASTASRIRRSRS